MIMCNWAAGAFNAQIRVLVIPGLGGRLALHAFHPQWLRIEFHNPPVYDLCMAVFKTGNRVQEVARPHRKGTVRIVHGTGINAQVWVNLDSWHPASFFPAQLALL